MEIVRLFKTSILEVGPGLVDVTRAVGRAALLDRALHVTGQASAVVFKGQRVL